MHVILLFSKAVTGEVQYASEVDWLPHYEWSILIVLVLIPPPKRLPYLSRIYSACLMLTVVVCIVLATALWFLQGQRSEIRRNGQRLPYDTFRHIREHTDCNILDARQALFPWLVMASGFYNQGINS